MKGEKKIFYSPGKPYPLGVSCNEKGINFSLFAKSDRDITLSLFSHSEDKEPFLQVTLDPKKNWTKDYWHICIENLPNTFFYAYQIGGRWVVDPYAKGLNTNPKWGKKPERYLGEVSPIDFFDWEGDVPLNLPFETLQIYEMHVRGFTKDPSSQAPLPGTFLGMIKKIPYLKNLGINAVELLPIFEFDETANSNYNPNTGEKLFNYWGYSTINFFSPMKSYGKVNDFKALVKALHQSGIEILLDVVFNHTGDFTLQGIDDQTYFILDENQNHTNYTGCGNTVNCNHPIVIEFILSSLRYWVNEMHVDGFRFDLASIFCRNHQGEVTANPPLIEAINQDPILSQTKLIAEAWDCAGLYQVGSFPGGDRWAEWNGKFRDIVRRFLKGTDGQSSAFASIMTGSQDLYGKGRAPFHSINFVTAHDGFTLRDLVSYNEKHNEENGEENRDGSNSNESWNCGIEGETTQQEVVQLREKQIRNFLVALTFAIGTPMYLMGDEYGHTRKGNNNAYCQDNRLNYFLWDILQQNHPLHDFLQMLITYRKESPFFQRKEFLSDQEIKWHGHIPNEPNWGHENRFVAYSLNTQGRDLYLAFNAHYHPTSIQLPQLPDQKKWHRIVDTALPNSPNVILEQEYFLHPYSTLVLENQSAKTN